MFRHLFDTIQRLVNLTVTLKTEGNGNDTYRQNTHLLRHTGNDRSSTSTRTTTHSGSDESHTCAIVEQVLDIIQTLLRSSTGLLRTVTGSKTFLAQLQMDGNWRIVQRLIIRITQYEGHIVDTLAIHVVDGITTTSTNTNHLDDAILFLGLAKIEQYVIIHNSILFRVNKDVRGN